MNAEAFCWNFKGSNHQSIFARYHCSTAQISAFPLQPRFDNEAATVLNSAGLCRKVDSVARLLISFCRYFLCLWRGFIGFLERLTRCRNECRNQCKVNTVALRQRGSLQILPNTTGARWKDSFSPAFFTGCIQTSHGRAQQPSGLIFPSQFCHRLDITCLPLSVAAISSFRRCAVFLLPCRVECK